ncbi:MAG: DciA family protein [Woeseiaceae bacterium]|nr:DciA family protein [Woeseiaceae bacterium]
MAQNDLKKLLNPNNDGELAGVIRRAREMGELTHVLCDSLPDEYAGAIAAANLRDDGSLVVIATSPAWASRLRYETDTLLSAARNAGCEVSQCRVRVTPQA